MVGFSGARRGLASRWGCRMDSALPSIPGAGQSGPRRFNQPRTAAITTYAIKDGQAAADSQATQGGYVTRAQKVWRLPDGGVATGCGSAPALFAGWRWLQGGEVGDPPDIEDAEIAIVRPDGSISVASGRWPAVPMLDREYAGGNGQDFARAAMAEGKSAVDAVMAACQHDHYSSGPIMAMTVYPPRDDGLEIYEIKAAGRKRKAKK